MRRLAWIVICLSMLFIILTLSCGKDKKSPTGPSDTDKDGETENKVVQTLQPDKEAEVVLTNELEVAIPENYTLNFNSECPTCFDNVHFAVYQLLAD